ncbi:Dirigent protein-like protein, partial [Drosera capensis]
MEDAEPKKFMVGRFLDFKMVNSKMVMSQVQELQIIYHEILTEGMKLCETLQVVIIIEKLPPLWKDLKNYLKHKRKEMKLEDLTVRLRIEEDNRMMDKKAKKMSIRKRKHPSKKKKGKGKKIKRSCFVYGKPNHKVKNYHVKKKDQEKKVYRLVKSLYGLKQPPKQWHEKFNRTMLSNRFKINECDKCVYFRSTPNVHVIVCLYVDEILIMGSNHDIIVETKKMLTMHFDMKDMGNANVILGIKILRTLKGLTLSQSHYVENILKKFNAFDNPSVKIPVDPNHYLVKKQREPISQLEYSRIIGSLMYIMNYTGLDIAYTVNRLTKKHHHTPCKDFVLYFHDIIYNCNNFKNATAAIVAAPQWGDLTNLAGFDHFGDIVVFNDPITLDNKLRSEPVGWAQGVYLYDKKEEFTAWLGFTFALNSTDYVGTLTFMGADPVLKKKRDVSIVGGTGDFFMARGVATLMTDAFEGEVYFRLRVHVKLYEC